MTTVIGQEMGQGKCFAQFIAPADGDLTVYANYECTPTINDPPQTSFATLKGWINGTLVYDHYDGKFSHTVLRWNPTIPMRAGEQISVLTFRDNHNAVAVPNAWVMQLDFA